MAHILGTEKPQVFFSRAYAHLLMADLEGKPIWHYGLTRDTTSPNLCALADLDGDGKMEIVVARKDGLLRAFDSEPLNEKCPTCPPDEPLTDVNHSGKPLWSRRFRPPISDFISADLDGDGKMEFLCGSGSGNLLALKERAGECSVLWSLDLGRTVGSPVIADVDGEGRPEILAPTEDGLLHCLGRSIPE